MPTNQEPPKLFAYLDHNILDWMIKGDPLDTKGLLKRTSLKPVFSNETLKEIHGSKGSEQKLLDLLQPLDSGVPP